MTDWSRLVDAIAARLAGHPGADGFLPALNALKAERPKSTGSRTERLPVQRFWPAAGSGDPLGALMAAVDDAFNIGWRQNPNYVAQPPSPQFLNNYGYVECAGPAAPIEVADFRLGLLLLGPGTLYPQHHHPAEEVYLPLGPGRWLRDDEDWRDRPAGAVIHHPPMCGHATQSGTEPLAAIYLWRGDVGPNARIT